jgi:pimeloyl-ACP methyl ester carboxylesterase
MPSSLLAWLRVAMHHLRQHHRLIFVVALLAELLNYRRHRKLLRCISAPNLGDRVGTMADVQWLLKTTGHSVCPMRLNAASLREYLPKGTRLDWRHYYQCFRGFLNLPDVPTKEQHCQLLQCTSQVIGAMPRRQNCGATRVEPPPPNAPVPVGVPPPVMYGVSELSVAYKPLVIDGLLGAVRLIGGLTLRLLGYATQRLATPEGEVLVWTRGFGKHVAAERRVPPTSTPSSPTPLVFIHGVGMGCIPYVEFLRHFTQPQILIELPNCSRANFQTQMPTPASVRSVLRSLLSQLNVGDYHLMGHSLGTDYCSIILNDPYEPSASEAERPSAKRRDAPIRSIRPSRVVLIDPICFAHEVAASHRLPFWDWEESCRKDTRTPWPARFLKLYLFIWDIYNQQACKRAIASGPEVLFRTIPLGTRVLVCLGGLDEAIPAWEVHDYVRAQYPEILVHMSPDYAQCALALTEPSFCHTLHRRAHLPPLSSAKARTNLARISLSLSLCACVCV